MWPVPGNDEELMSETIHFITTKLRVTRDDCCLSDITRVRRTWAPKKSSMNHEVSVVFNTKVTRDTVSAHGKNLTIYKTEEGWPTAGLRIEYPSHLAQDFRHLDWYGTER